MTKRLDARTSHAPSSGPLSCSRVPRDQRTRPIPLWPVHVATEESHRRALELQRAAVGGAPSVRSSVHPTATLECEQLQQPAMPAMAGGLWHHPGGARDAAPSLCFAMAGAACAHRPSRSHTQPRLTARCAPCAAGACLSLPLNHHIVRATWLGSATTCIGAAACLVHHVHHRVCGTLSRALHVMSGGG